eukprot:TRINITY_DN101719_c0_g1_i1.p1 TRINITY_DN101719_c0_g1~~TRINITY_DN101719_c0_g1_i1.p1  ORF type:complete len:167 (+),score=33.81 TRINITY_DN101719_c0_g1_i1:91-591(+)
MSPPALPICASELGMRQPGLRQVLRRRLPCTLAEKKGREGRRQTCVQKVEEEREINDASGFGNSGTAEFVRSEGASMLRTTGGSDVAAEDRCEQSCGTPAEQVGLGVFSPSVLIEEAEDDVFEDIAKHMSCQIRGVIEGLDWTKLSRRGLCRRSNLVNIGAAAVSA